jgi:hypothetical protein
MNIRKFLYSGAAATTLAIAGIGVTAGPASADATCQEYYGNYQYYTSLGDTNETIAVADYTMGDIPSYMYYAGLAESYYDQADTWFSKYNSCNIRTP